MQHRPLKKIQPFNRSSLVRQEHVALEAKFFHCHLLFLPLHNFGRFTAGHRGAEGGTRGQRSTWRGSSWAQGLHTSPHSCTMKDFCCHLLRKKQQSSTICLKRWHTMISTLLLISNAVLPTTGGTRFTRRSRLPGRERHRRARSQGDFHETKRRGGKCSWLPPLS